MKLLQKFFNIAPKQIAVKLKIELFFFLDHLSLYPGAEDGALIARSLQATQDKSLKMQPKNCRIAFSEMMTNGFCFLLDASKTKTI